MRAERLTDVITYHGEGPVWWPRLEALRCVDMLAGDVLTLGADGQVTRTATGSDVAAVVRPFPGLGGVVALERGLAVSESDDLSGLRYLGDVLPEGQRFNEGGCDPQGRFWVGSLAYDKTEGGATLRRWDDAGAHIVLDHVTTSNGIGWSPDGSVVYYNDTRTKQVACFDFDPATGALGDRRVFVDLTAEGGRPDGLTVDAEGGVWIALFGGSAVRRYGADGALTHQVEVGARQVTACTFGGPDLDTLFITTSRENLDADDDPAAGSIFTLHPGVRGLPVLEADPRLLQES